MGLLLIKAARRWFWTLASIGVILIIGFGRCAMAECLSSAAEVRASHGATAWSTWRYVDGHKCYMMGERHKIHYRAGAKPKIVSFDLVPSQRDVGRTVGSIPATGAISTEPENTEVFSIVTVICDDNCLRLWESFNILSSMERLLPYRVRAAVWDERYTAWLSQR